MVICPEQGADLHMALLMPVPLTVSCFSKIQIGFTFLVPAHPGSQAKGAVKRVCYYYYDVVCTTLRCGVTSVDADDLVTSLRRLLATPGDRHATELHRQFKVCSHCARTELDSSDVKCVCAASCSAANQQQTAGVT